MLRVCMLLISNPTSRKMRYPRLRQVSTALTRTLIYFAIANTTLALAQSSSPTILELEFGQCKMSSEAQAAVTLYIIAFLTIVSTIANPFIDSFVVAWMSWLPFVRAAAGAVIHVRYILGHVQEYIRKRSGYEVLQEPHADDDIELEAAGGSKPQRVSQPRDYFSDDEAHTASHVVWWTWHLYVPLSQWTWFLAHGSTASAGVVFARATAVGIVLVSMSIDSKTRVVRAMAARKGAFVGLLMAVLSFVVRWALLVLIALEYLAVLRNADASTQDTFRIVVPIYCVFSIIWGAASFYFVRSRDEEACKAGDPWSSVPIAFRAFFRVFSNCFTCLVAVMMLLLADDSNGLMTCSSSATLPCSSRIPVKFKSLAVLGSEMFLNMSSSCTRVHSSLNAEPLDFELGPEPEVRASCSKTAQLSDVKEISAKRNKVQMAMISAPLTEFLVTAGLGVRKDGTADDANKAKMNSGAMWFDHKRLSDFA
ncbi:hypothetical protein AX16_007788 [Volvariella volvacea WC 439]|nr:hypothetical protein AX16_007788 [Volvariella volvacea WC 439]